MLKTLILTIFILLLLISTTICQADVIDDADIIEELVPLICMAESSGNPNASDGKSYGLMGITPIVLKEFIKNSSDEFDKTIHWENERNKYILLHPEFNKKVGTWYLHKIQSWLPGEYKNSKPHIIFAYNSGIGKLKKNNWRIPSWTKNHPNKIYRKI